jgi:uncharacterized membrane protein
MTDGSIFLAGKDWFPACAVSFAIALAFILWSYVRAAPASHGLRFTCALLKILGTVILLACLLEPMWSGQRARPGANVLAIIADNSLSMKLRSTNPHQSRGEQLRGLLEGEGSLWRRKLGDEFQVRNYLADARLTATNDFSELVFDGRSTALGDALRSLQERTHGQPLAGVILLTDGVASDLKAAELTGLPPIYPVVFGSEEPPRDLAIAATSVSQTAFEDSPVTVQVDVNAVGLAGDEIIATLAPADGASGAQSEKPSQTQTLKVPREGEKLVVRFQLRPEKAGVSFYRVELKAKSAKSEEATLENNRTVVAVDRGAGPYRILYVSGRPNWEYKFLHRAVEADDQTQIVALIRVAKREPKFEFKSRAGESSNPLFRGFGNQSKEDIERYDQPVFVRLNTEDEYELRDGFPKTAEQLFKYRAVIVDDLEAEFFSAEQMTLIQQFVSERGGGFLMLGGAESFVDGRYGRTPIGDMLPVYVDQGPSAPRDAEMQLNLTREGWLQPWARLRSNESDERGRMEAQPPLNIVNRVRGTKPAATVIATVTDGKDSYPALVAQRFGRGRSAALLLGDFWQTGLGDEARQKDLGKAWRQMIRWLVADVPERIEVRAEPQANGQDIRLQTRVRDAKFEPLENASVAIKVQPLGSAQPITLTAEPSLTEPGVFESTYIVRDSGGFRVDASVTDESGRTAGAATTGWATDLANAEFRSLVPNRALLESVARKTGGKTLNPDDLARFADELPTKRAPITETWTRPLWHTPWMLLLALGCFLGEWGLRRWKGLA